MLDRVWLKAFLPIGVLQNTNQWQPVGAGVLFVENPFVWFLTAAHVLKMHEPPYLALVNDKAGNVHGVNLTADHQRFGLDWVIDNELDLAGTLMTLKPEFDISAVSREVCLPLAQALPSMPAYTIGCPYGSVGFDNDKPTPLVLDGIIAGVSKQAKRIFTTAPTFPGNSGGPLLAIRVPFSAGGSMHVGANTVFFAGIVSSYTLFRSPDPKLPASLPPLHLGSVVSADSVLDFLDSPAARAQIELGKKLAEKEAQQQSP